jgi:hypothetical protein
VSFDHGPFREKQMNTRLLSILIIGAMMGLAIGFSVHEFSRGGVFFAWITGRTWQDALVWLIGGIIVAAAVAYLKGEISPRSSSPRR